MKRNESATRQMHNSQGVARVFVAQNDQVFLALSSIPGIYNASYLLKSISNHHPEFLNMQKKSSSTLQKCALSILADNIG
jgi:hypothetical protein